MCVPVTQVSTVTRESCCKGKLGEFWGDLNLRLRLKSSFGLYVWQTPRTPHAENFDIIFAFWMSANGSPLCSSSNCEIPPSKCQTFSVAELSARCHVLRDTSWPTSNHFLSSPHCSLPIVHPGPHIPLGQFQQPSFLWDPSLAWSVYTSSICNISLIWLWYDYTPRLKD